MATASPHDAALRDVLDRLHAATRELARHDELPGLGERAVELALGLTASAEAVLAIDSRQEGYRRIFSRAADRTRRIRDEDALRMLVAPGMSAQLQAGEQGVGAIAVDRPSAYTDNERLAFAIFASYVAYAVEASLLRGHRDERAHERTADILAAVSAHAVAGLTLADFYSRLANTVAGLVDARRVLFWRLDDEYMLAPAGGFGVDDAFVSRLNPVRSHPEADDLASRVVHKDLMFRANSTSEFAEYAYVLERLGVESAISVPWRAGEKRLGLVAAYDSTRPGAFSHEDTRVLQKAALASGLVTLLWETQEDLRKSVDRLSKVDSARQLLLKNTTTVAERERKRFVSELHDDALQKLTAAEMHLERLAPEGKLDLEAVDKLRELLEQTESSLRRLVFDVRPPALESAGGLEQSIRDRVSMLSGSGIKTEVDMDVPDDLSLDVKALLFRQIAEAVGNAERHSRAKTLSVSLKVLDGGIRGLVIDDGEGFNVVERSNVPGHLGLLALRERALMAGGWYKIESEPGAGTHVEFWVPLEG